MSKWSRVICCWIGVALAGLAYEANHETASLHALDSPGASVYQVPSSVGSPSSSQLLGRYCFTCHNQRLNTAGLALDTLDVGNIGGAPETWEKVLRKLSAGVMPPVGMPRPDKPAYDGVVSWLETELDRAAAAAPNPGRTNTFRRLNRTEYRNAIRDLLVLELDVSALLPADDTSDGFDNISVGGLSPTLLERYLSAAGKISRAAVGSPVRSPAADTLFVREDLNQDEHIEGLPFGTRGGTLVPHTFPLDGEYEVRVRLGRNRNGRIAGLKERHELEITVDGERVQLFPVGGKPEVDLYEPGSQGEEGEADDHLNVRLPVKAGPRVLGVAFLNKSSAQIETLRQPWLRRHNSDYGDLRTQPVVFSVNIAGPFEAGGSGDTPSRRRLFLCDPARPSDEARCARTILSTLARRAYRRPVTDEDLKPLLEFYDDGRAEGNFESGIETALQALLVSPEFLFRIERDPENPPTGGVYRISDFELASRLSFFLWSSIPDDELLDLASKRELRKPAVLERQVRRMLVDARSDALVTNFAGQWLYLRNLESTTPDPRLFPNFDDGLRQAFRRETELFFESILREDRSVLDLMRADYTFVNERLARHYEIPNVYGSHFRRVTLADQNRRGLLGQGSILTVTSYATRTSPVLRGKWVLENILGTPPPAPPPNVPPLPEKKEGTGKVLNMRERMAQHRSNPVCASCHSMIDPAGFALEHFDAVGQWRDVDEAFNEIDTSGTLPDGAKFDSVAGLRQALLSEPERFVTTVTEKLLTYALGRGVEYYDMPAVRKIVKETAARDYQLTSLIQGIINSTPFQMRRSL